MDEPTVVVGLVTKAHGLRGEVLVEIRSDNPDRWAPGSVVLDEAGRRLTVGGVRGRAGRAIVTFEEVGDRDAAEALRGRTLVVPVSWLPPLPAGEYWPHELEGCEVVTESGRILGRVTDVVPNPANDLWVAADERGTETIVPAIRDVVAEVDVWAKRILVRDVPGLTAPDEPG